MMYLLVVKLPLSQYMYHLGVCDLIDYGVDGF